MNTFIRFAGNRSGIGCRSKRVILKKLSFDNVTYVIYA
jgi:hypothetical protein